jgi:DNA modification methylase|tara:strand:+ start:790 stop:2049 length:1260 start_codon:yes stop_codon:yes gene_type:complete
MHGVGFVQSVLSNPDFIEQVKSFNEFGTDTIIELFEWEIDGKSGVVEKAINEYWTSGQRQAHSLHEISYRACYKPQLPRFFIERLTQQGDAVYDPFMGRGTTQLESWLMGRKPLGNDINPLSKVLLEPRLNPPSLEQIEKRLNEIDLRIAKEEYPELLAFYHRDTLTQIIALKEYLLGREESGEIDNVDKWIRMVAINRLTGHSNGFFSVYTLPPNQAVSIRSQERINERRNQTPESKDIIPRIVRKSKSLLRKWRGLNLNQHGQNFETILSTSDARNAEEIQSESAQLVVTSPPFLDIVDYQADNWLRCWFIDIDSSTIEISQLKKVDDWQNAMTEVLKDLYRIVKTGGYVAFEVGEVRNGKVLLEELVVPAGLKAGLEPIIIMINSQDFTKTANAWGVKNQTQGTNTNRIVVFQKQS